MGRSLSHSATGWAEFRVNIALHRPENVYYSQVYDSYFSRYFVQEIAYSGPKNRSRESKSIALTYGKVLESFFDGLRLVSVCYRSSQVWRHTFFASFWQNFFFTFLCARNGLQRTKEPVPCIRIDRLDLWVGPWVILQRVESRFGVISILPVLKTFIFR